MQKLTLSCLLAGMLALAGCSGSQIPSSQAGASTTATSTTAVTTTTLATTTSTAKPVPPGLGPQPVPNPPLPTVPPVTTVSPMVTAPPLSVEVSGGCMQGGIDIKANGFTPNGSVTMHVDYPVGSRYSHSLDRWADYKGNFFHHWDCFQTDLNPPNNGAPDPVGEYRLRLTDVITGNDVRTTFTVAY